MKKIIFFIIISRICYAELINIYPDGQLRYYWIDYPADATEPVPLIVNMHGLGGWWFNQIWISQMSDFALPQNIAVVYPQGLNDFGFPAWNAGIPELGSTFNDVGYINAVIDSVVSNYEIDTNRIYASGYSNGGFMTYDLACELNEKIVAFGIVGGHFILNPNQDCTSDRGIPIMHIHGTADSVVLYDYPVSIYALTVNESIDFWVEQNDLTEESYDQLNDFVHFYRFSSLDSSTEFVHIRADNGGHVWFGYDWGFHSSIELINFFMQFSMNDYDNDSEPIMGDINGDGVLSTVDIISCIFHIIGTNILNYETSLIFDLDYNSNVDIFDINIAVDLVSGS